MWKKKMEVVKIITRYMPAYCGDCKLINYERKICMPTGRDITNNLLQESEYGIIKRPSFCPLIEPYYLEILSREESFAAERINGELRITYHWKEDDREGEEE